MEIKMRLSGIFCMVGAGVIAGALAAGASAEAAGKADWKKGAGVGAWLAVEAEGAEQEAEKAEQKPEDAKGKGRPEAASEDAREKGRPEASSEEMKKTDRPEQAQEEEEKSFETLVMADVNNILNVRTAPDSEAELEGYLYADCGGVILERRDGWTKLESGELKGWAKDDYLLFGEEAQDAARDAGREVATTTTGALRIRKEPSEDAGVYDLLEEGAKYEVVNDEQVEFAGGKEIPDGWVAVDYGGKTGYVSADYVDVSFEVDFGETLEQVEERRKAEQKQEEASKKADAEKASKKENKKDGQKKTENSDIETLKAAAASVEDSVLLAALIQCEAGDEPYEGQVAVGAVVMNRVKSGAYPNTVKDVIYASGQFTPAGSGRVARVIASGKVKQSCLQAAQEAMAGVSPVGTATHFRRAGSREGLVVGSHVFW